MDLLESVSRNALRTVHIHNYSPTISLEDDPTTPGIIRRHYQCTYSVSARHLRGNKGTYHLRLRQELSDPHGKLGENPLKQCEIRAGSHRWGLADIKVEQRRSGGTTVTLLSLDRDIDVVGEMAVSISEEARASVADPTEIIYAWYPTHGFRATILYRAGMAYDVAWLKSWTGLTGDFPGREQVIEMPTGITAYTDEWVLPGNGVILYWFPTDNQTAST
ncbi:MAG: hypothetical protein AB7G10_24755 [Reyranellaceae bacterium]